MKMKICDKIQFYVFLGLSIAVLCFIFSQSILSKEESGALSGGILALLKPILDPYNKMDFDTFHHLIRKAAHFTEFAAFGFCVAGATTSFGVLRSRKYASLPLLITLGCAVSDEFLQYFTGRGSMVTDVVLDYAGALFGMGLFAMIHILLNKSKQ